MKGALLFFLLIIESFLLATPPSFGEEQKTHKTECKFLIDDLTKLPPSWLHALQTGQDHKDLLRKGVVLQQYLSVTKQTIMRIYRELAAACIPFGPDRQISDFLFPGRVQEIRLLRKMVKEGDHVQTIFQVAFQSNGEISFDVVESPEKLSSSQMGAMQKLFASLQNQVVASNQKIFFECIAYDAEDNPLVSQDGSFRTVEIDIFLSTQGKKIVPLFVDAEIKFKESDERKGLIALMEFRERSKAHPSFFAADVTGQKAYLGRNLATRGKNLSLPKLPDSNKALVSDLVEECRTWVDPEFARCVFEAPSHNKRVLSQKVLMSAEPFGFGPSAAIAEFFPYLREQISILAYIGGGHTLDLQRKLPYDAIYDIGSIEKEKRRAYFLSVAKEYDVLISASDFEAAKWAKQAGLKVILYDPLTWYWSELPKSIRTFDLFIAQNFFGVFERVKSESELFPETIIVPPIISGIFQSNDTDTLLVNLGGLSNPYLDDKDIEAYAKAVFQAIDEALHGQFQEVRFVTNRNIAESLQGTFSISTLLPSEVQELLSKSKLAIMTSGLGNIYEASAMKKTVLWLPPANDSQGQQITRLAQHHMIDASIDWHELLDGEEPINYFLPQEKVLEQIAVCMRKLAIDSKAKEKLKALIKQQSAKATQKQPKLAKLIKVFEIDGAKQASESILGWLLQREDQ